VTISADTQITDLTVNDHACLTFGEPEELFDLTAAFVRDGLDGGLKVVWLSDATPDRATAEQARRGVAVEPALASGQLAAVGYEGRLLTGQVFSAGKGDDLADPRDSGQRCGDVTVNMAPLAFIDVTCARMILDAPRGLNPKAPPRRMILRCRPGLAARFVRLGAADIPGVSLVSADDQ
jgi:hypothetical protein